MVRLDLIIVYVHSNSHYDGFFYVFFRIYVNLWYTAIKDLVCLFFLLTITGKNEAIIVQLKKVIFFEWHFYHLFRGFPSLDFSQLWKMVLALAFNSIIVATSAWRGKWNRHVVVPSDKFFTQMPKMKIDYVHCPMRKFWRTSLRPVGQNNVGISKNWDVWGRLH